MKDKRLQATTLKERISNRTMPCFFLKYTRHCAIIQANTRYLEAKPGNELLPTPVSDGGRLSGHRSIAADHYIFKDILAICINANINQGFLSFFVDSIIKMDTNTTGLRKDLLDDVPADDGPCKGFRISLLV